ncbi:lysosomal acid glucosylceramidase-like isoform X2 [Bacillus rossius redtenbacheri]|uniref:lysosomal acid glucosylceramidase-like isoform X2 n=1 Tax=Bacillus rossius redtenbacheri TaxID=93214 RepID=UPI002FDEDD89
MSFVLALVLCISVSATGARAEFQRCVPRQYQYDSIVCVCNATYYDTVEPVSEGQISGGAAKHYVSDMAGRRLEPMLMKFSASGARKSAVSYSVDRSVTYQKMLGFGGAVSDSAAIVTSQLSKGAQEHLLRSYFGQEGIDYSLIRLPMGGSDFSTRYYSLDDVSGDTTLQHFSLTEEDYKYKIPFVKRLQEISPRPVKLFTTAWSAPDWMKDIGTNIGYSSLKTQYYQLWAEYFIKFLDAYTKENVTFWAITPQNEPTHGTIFHTKFNNMGWTAGDQLTWLADHLIPALRERHPGVELMLFDDQRPYLKEWMDLQLANETVRKYASGMGVHWYADILAAASVMDTVHQEYPEKFLLYTESSVIHLGNVKAVRLGLWERGEQYMTSITEVSNHWVSGWVDWNLALDTDGGPNWANNSVDGAVIVNATADEFYKQPMFYALAHFSAFVQPGSVRVGLRAEGDSDLQAVAFLTPENVTVLVFHNVDGDDVDVVIKDSERGSLSVKISGTSFNTILYK